MADGSALPTRTRRKLMADLWCGAGGTSTGAVRAMRDLGQPFSLASVNHWPTAIDTHRRNHPEHADRTHCADLEVTRPIAVVPEGYLDLLMASPTCTFHSRARGGKPVNDQQRMDPWHVVRWCTELRVKRLLVENVPEIMDWGPCSLVTGRPIPSRKGEYFRAWIDALKAIGFRLDYRVLCAADFGDPTTRQRFFLIGRTDRGALRWPTPGYSKAGTDDLLDVRARWRGAVEIIDWTLPGNSIFTRKKPLKPNTIRRILAGAKRYRWPVSYQDALQALLDGTEPVLELGADAAAAAPFTVHFRGTAADQVERSAHAIADPLPALTAGGTHVGLIMATGAGGVARDVSQPIPTITAGGEGGARPHFVTPLIMGVHGQALAKSTEHPLPTITTGGASSEHRPGNARPQLIEPLVAPYYGGGSGLTASSAEEPLPTVTTKARFGLAEPVVLSTSNSSSAGVPRSVEEPLRTITATGHQQLATPVADGYRIDILYRMLNYRELARGMSLDDEGSVYDFAGTSTEITKQIGNAVPCRLAKALVRALMEDA